MIKKDFTLEADLESGYATIRFYETKSHYKEDDHIIDHIKQTGWVRVSLDDIGKTMKDRGIKEFSTEEDIQFSISMHNSIEEVK
jgi:hypothetical protein